MASDVEAPTRTGSFLTQLPTLFAVMAEVLAWFFASADPDLFRHPGTIPRLALLAGSSAGLFAFGSFLAERSQRLSAGSSRKWIRSAFLLIGSAAALAFANPPSSHLGQPGWRFFVFGAIAFGLVVYGLGPQLPPFMGLLRCANCLLGPATAGVLPFAYVPWHLAALLVPEFVYVTALTFLARADAGGSSDRRRIWACSVTMAVVALLNTHWGPTWQWAAMVSMDVAEGRPVHQPSWVAFGTGGTLASWILLRAYRARGAQTGLRLARDGAIGLILLNATQLLSYSLSLEAAMVGTLTIPALISGAFLERGDGDEHRSRNYGAGAPIE